MAIGAVVGSIITYLVQIRSQPSSRIEAAEIDYGMSKEHIRGMLGQPDDIDIVPPGVPAILNEYTDAVRREVWGYGPFGAYRSYSGLSGHTTKYRLLVMFVGDEVVEWTKSAPLDEQPPQR
jgi:hypothetical protein